MKSKKDYCGYPKKVWAKIETQEARRRGYRNIQRVDKQQDLNDINKRVHERLHEKMIIQKQMGVYKQK